LAKTSSGKCIGCDQTFDKRNITKHLSTCEQLKNVIPPSSTEGLHIIVTHGGYWLHLAAPQDLTLAQLDGFLRNIWLECCGHMSAFTIGGRRYTGSSRVDMGERSMNVALGKVLTHKTRFLHEYDFGSTTQLTLLVNGPWQMPEQREKSVALLARNNPPK
jgi:hypothetical protein